MDKHPDDKVDFYLDLWEPVGRVGQRKGGECEAATCWTYAKMKKKKKNSARAGNRICRKGKKGTEEEETGCYSQSDSFTVNAYRDPQEIKIPKDSIAHGLEVRGAVVSLRTRCTLKEDGAARHSLS